MDAEKIFYGIDKVKKRRSPWRIAQVAIALLLASGFIVYWFYPELEQWFGKSEDISRKLIVRNTETQWISTPKGYLFFVRGEIMNESPVPVSYIKLRSSFKISGRTVHSQDLYSGNTLSMMELRNADMTYSLEKLSRKHGDDLSAFADSQSYANFDIKPGNTVFFNTFYLSVNKILGLKCEIEITDFEVTYDK